MPAETQASLIAKLYASGAARADLEAAIDTLVEKRIREERSECLKLAANYGGREAEEIAEMIGSRNFSQ